MRNATLFATALAALALPALAAPAVERLNARDVAGLLAAAGKPAEVAGRVAATRDDARAKVVVLAFGTDDASFAAIIPQAARATFAKAGVADPASRYRGKPLTVVGYVKVGETGGKKRPVIVVTKPSQLAETPTN